METKDTNYVDPCIGPCSPRQIYSPSVVPHPIAYHLVQQLLLASTLTPVSQDSHYSANYYEDIQGLCKDEFN